jgi:hypothetical protein
MTRHLALTFDVVSAALTALLLATMAVGNVGGEG